MVLSNRPGRSRPGSAGVPVPGSEVRLLDPDGRAVGDGEPGVLHVRTPSLSPAYWNRLDASRRAFVGEWFRTGDVMTRDGDGFFQHVGRDDDLFKVAGMWVAPSEVEAVLLAHPGVAEAAVVGLPDDDLGQRIVAFIVGSPDRRAQPQELIDYVAEQLSVHKRPREVRIVAELPRNAMGKVLKKQLLT